MTTYATGAHFYTDTHDSYSPVDQSVVDTAPPPLATPTARGRATSRHRVTVDARRHTFTVSDTRDRGGDDTGPTATEYVLGGLAASLSNIIGLVAEERGLTVRSVEVLATGTVDPRGAGGNPNVKTHFQTITGRVGLDASLDFRQLSSLVHEVERRCPVHNLLSDAGVPPRLRWVLAAA